MTAQRIFDTARIKAKRQKDHYTGNKTARAPKLFRTPTPCSCWMCGNPRKWFKQPTIQERRFAQKELM